MLARLGIRVVASLVGILIGLIVSLALLDGFSATAKALVVSTLLFWGVYLVVNFVALRILIRSRRSRWRDCSRSPRRSCR